MPTKKLTTVLVDRRFAIWDGVLIAMAGGILVFLGIEFDLFRSDGLSVVHAGQLDFTELVFIALTLSILIAVSNRRIREQQREVARRTEAERRARELAFQDPLTGLPNRRQFDEVVAEAIAAPPGADRTHAVLMMDLNQFKNINDVHGHPVGDEVLIAVADRIKGAFRETDDLVARLGGDEFAVVARHLHSAESATGVGLRIIEAMKDPIRVANITHLLSIGIGIALIPKDGVTAEEIVRRADIALYRAKSEPISALRFFEEEMDLQIRERALIEGELRNALSSGDIQPYYQPVVDLQTDQVVGFEALARWHHGDIGLVTPDRFIPVAEESGLINELGEQLLRVSIADAKDWPKETTLAVNVSPVQLHTQDFGARIMKILQETGFDPLRLELEITENTLVRDLQVAKKELTDLREVGVRIALDDFGTGYSSLYHLRSLKVDRIKIDRSFVQNLATDGESAAIVSALLGLGHGLGVQVTAEGVEDVTQRSSLAEQGCSHGQGFLFGRAISAGDAKALFRDASSRAQP